jgi:nucleoside 2-deoxyribosyltransferase
VEKVYLCGPINGKTDSECNDWRTTAKSLLSEKFHVVDPMSRDFRGREDLNIQTIVEGDIADIDSCEFVLVCASSPSWGTAMELRHAFVSGKKIVAFSESESVSPWLKYHCHGIYPTLQLACTALCQRYRSRYLPPAVVNFDVREEE